MPETPSHEKGGLRLTRKVADTTFIVIPPHTEEIEVEVEVIEILSTQVRLRFSGPQEVSFEREVR